MPNVTGIKTAADVDLWFIDRGGGVTGEADPQLIPKVQYYKHFDLTSEQLGRTTRYNCWAFTFLPRRYWLATHQDVDQIIQDNCVPVAPGAVRLGDVIRYRDSYGKTTHTGRVWETDGAGHCTKVRSKWGEWAEYVHDPKDPYIYTEDVYGTNLAYFRQVAPLRGVGDLWIRDAADDTGEQYSYSLWASPDIVVDAPPYGSSDLNPVFGQVNHVWAVVHNRSNADIASVRVRYCWADPHAGFAPSNWKLIPGTAAHPNPTNTFTVPANSSAQAPYAEWTPVPVPGVADPAHQCLLAVAFTNDDPTDSSNPNPIVYPFDIRWENNVAARNVHVATLNKNMKVKLELATALPLDGIEKATVKLRARLTCLPRLPIFGFPPTVVPPLVKVTVGGRRPFVLTDGRAVVPIGEVWGLRVEPRSMDFELLGRNCDSVFMPTMAEKTIAWKEVDRLPLVLNKPVPIHLEIAATKGARPGSNFYLRVEQELHGQVTGCYTVVISIV